MLNLVNLAHHIDLLVASLDEISPFWALIGPFWALIGIWGGVAQMESEFKTRKPNLATFGQIIYYISSRILENHSVESRKDLIT